MFFLDLTQTTQLQFLKLFSRKKSDQDEKVLFIKGNELTVTQVELISFFFFKDYIYFSIL